MSLNLGEAVEAARRLHTGDFDHAESAQVFGQVRSGILEQLRVKMNYALECPPEARLDATGYARALRDVYVALEVAATRIEPNIRSSDNPGPIAKPPRA